MTALLLRCFVPPPLPPSALVKPLLLSPLNFTALSRRRIESHPPTFPRFYKCRKFSYTVSSTTASSSPPPSMSDLDDVLKGYMFGQKKATEVAHLVWKVVVQKSDIVVDATCGNGNDTLALAKLVTDDLGKGCVYGMDVQEDAIKNTSSLLDRSLDQNQRKSVKLFPICHSNMMEALPKDSSVRLVAFNLGYLPGGDKGIITKSATTLLALKAAKELLLSGGVISVVAYVGHPGGREEYETVRAFASELPADSWVCSHIQMLNKQLAPILVFLFKR